MRISFINRVYDEGLVVTKNYVYYWVNGPFYDDVECCSYSAGRIYRRSRFCPKFGDVRNSSVCRVCLLFNSCAEMVYETERCYDTVFI